MDSEELANNVVVYLESDNRAQLKQFFSKLLQAFGKAPLKEIDDDAYVTLCAHFASADVGEFGDVAAQVLVDDMIAEMQRLPFETIP